MDDQEIRRMQQTLERLERAVMGNDTYAGLRAEFGNLKTDFYGDPSRDRKGVLKTVNEMSEEFDNFKVGLRWLRAIAGFFGVTTITGAFAMWRLFGGG